MSLRQYARDATKRQKDALKAIRKARGESTFTDTLEDFVKNPRETISSYTNGSRKPRYGPSAVDKVERFVTRTGFATAAIGIPLIAALYLTKPDPIKYQLPAAVEQHSWVEDVRPSEIAIEQGLEELAQKDISETGGVAPQEPSSVDESSVREASVAQRQQDYTFEQDLAEQPQTWSDWNSDYKGLELTKDVTFAPGQQLYKTFIDAGVPKEVAIASVEESAVDNGWYAQERIIDGELREGENPLVLDSFPQAGKTYTLTLDATAPMPEVLAEAVPEVLPIIEPTVIPYTPQNGIGVLAALKETIGDEELYKQASGLSLIATGLENNLFPERCLTETGGFNHDSCRPALDIKPWRAGQEYTLVVDMPEFSKENDYGGNFNYTAK